MGKAKMFGAVAIIVGLLLGLVSYVLVPGGMGAFLAFVVSVYLPVLLITIGLLAIVIGVLLLIYG